MARGEVGTGEHGGEENSAETLAAPRPVERRHGLLEVVDRPTIVPPGLVGDAEVFVHEGLQDGIPPAVASARARWAVTMAWSYAPMR